MDDTFYDGHDELYQHAKFGEDRTTGAGCRCENVVFVFFLFFFYGQDCRAAANCRYCFYSQAKNQSFRPAGATHCNDSRQTLQDRRAPGSPWLCKISHESVQTGGKFQLFGKESPRTFYDGHDELYQHAKFGEDRITRAGCRCENVVFVFFTGRNAA